MNYYIVPDRFNLEKSIELAEKYSLGFEFDDFFSPKVLADPQNATEIIKQYESYTLPKHLSLHGAFFDITVFSSDPEIAALSDKRIRQSLEYAHRLNAEKVIFHTNYIPNFNDNGYRESWLEENVRYWSGICDENKDLQILMENMFDIKPDLIIGLADKMKATDNFGICFDLAHAVVFGENADEWIKTVLPYAKHFHINDNGGEADEHLALGDGKIDFSSFFEAVKNFDCRDILLEMSETQRQQKSIDYLIEKGYF